jgi:alcohol dehydrogenase YqhD (iron-dependent ADH family)
MKTFTVYIPTRLFFGPEHLGAFCQEVRAAGEKVLLCIGGGSVKRLGYLETLTGGLLEAGCKVEVFSGIEPNPEARTCDKGAEAGRAFGAEVILALGGGSTMDAAKAIGALIATGEKEVWPFVKGEPRFGELTSTLPIFCVPTTAATASEVTPYAVISNSEKKGKAPLAYEFFKPRASWLNPAFTTELTTETTRDGAADILSHVFENYLLGGESSPLADQYSEMVMRTVIETLPLLTADPKSLTLRGDLLWASSLALNGMQVAGRNPSEFVLHSIEHAMSAYQPKLAHGRGLATLFPVYFEWLEQNNRAVERLAKLGRTLFGVTETDNLKASRLFRERFTGWLKTNNLFQSATSTGVNRSDFDKIAAYCVEAYGTAGKLNALGPMSKEDVVTLLEMTER